MAAVLSSSLSRILERSLAQVNVRTTSSQMVVAEHRGPVDRGTPQGRPAAKPRGHPVIKRVYETARHQATPPATYAASASADVAPAQPVTATHQPTLSAATGGTGETNTRTTRPASPSVSSHASSSPGAAVSPTGESGALGPVQSPNG